MFKLEIDTGNAAFDDDNANAEIARILREVARRVEGDIYCGKWAPNSTADINGNVVCTFRKRD